MAISPENFDAAADGLALVEAIHRGDRRGRDLLLSTCDQARTLTFLAELSEALINGVASSRRCGNAVLMSELRASILSPEGTA